MEKQAERESVKVPLYWFKMFSSMKISSIGMLVDCVCIYSFYGQQISTDTMDEYEKQAWNIMKRDLDYQFTHRKAYRFPDDEPMRVRNSQE